MKALDKKFCSEKKKVVFIIYNCAKHTEDKSLKLKKVRLFICHPMPRQRCNQGVILSFKNKYCNFLIKDKIKALDQWKEF